MDGWIKLHRKLIDKGWYKNSDKVRMWIHLLLSATHKEMEAMFNGKNIKLKPGQFITGRKALSTEIGINESKVERTLLFFEKNEKQIEQQKCNRNRLITILNWDEHQLNEQQVNNKLFYTSNLIMTIKRRLNMTKMSDSKKTKILTKLSKIEQQNEQQTDVVNDLISIIFELSKYESEQQNEQQVNNKRTTSEQQVNTNKNIKNIKNDKKEEKLKQKEKPDFLKTKSENESRVETKEKEKSSGGEKEKERFEINYIFNSDEFLKLWQIWKDYKKEQHKFQYKSKASEQAALNQLCNLSDGDEQFACKIINETMAHGWKGLENGKKSLENGKTISKRQAERIAFIKGQSDFSQ